MISGFSTSLFAGKRPSGAILAGVCARLAGQFKTDPWLVRCIFLVAFVVNALIAGLLYLVLAFFLYKDSNDRVIDGEFREIESQDSAPPVSGQSQRQARIAALERRLREAEAAKSRYKKL